MAERTRPSSAWEEDLECYLRSVEFPRLLQHEQQQQGRQERQEGQQQQQPEQQQSEQEQGEQELWRNQPLPSPPFVSCSGTSMAGLVAASSYSSTTLGALMPPAFGACLKASTSKEAFKSASCYSNTTLGALTPPASHVPAFKALQRSGSCYSSSCSAMGSGTTSLEVRRNAPTSKALWKPGSCIRSTTVGAFTPPPSSEVHPNASVSSAFQRSASCTTMGSLTTSSEVHPNASVSSALLVSASHSRSTTMGSVAPLLEKCRYASSYTASQESARRSRTIMASLSPLSEVPLHTRPSAIGDTPIMCTPLADAPSARTRVDVTPANAPAGTSTVLRAPCVLPSHDASTPAAALVVSVPQGHVEARDGLGYTPTGDWLVDGFMRARSTELHTPVRAL